LSCPGDFIRHSRRSRGFFVRLAQLFVSRALEGSSLGVTEGLVVGINQGPVGQSISCSPSLFHVIDSERVKIDISVQFFIHFSKMDVYDWINPLSSQFVTPVGE
jgi:hypothetical protein